MIKTLAFYKTTKTKLLGQVAIHVGFVFLVFIIILIFTNSALSIASLESLVLIALVIVTITFITIFIIANYIYSIILSRRLIKKINIDNKEIKKSTVKLLYLDWIPLISLITTFIFYVKIKNIYFFANQITAEIDQS